MVCDFAGVAATEEYALDMLSGVTSAGALVDKDKLNPCLQGTQSASFDIAVTSEEITRVSETTDRIDLKFIVPLS